MGCWKLRRNPARRLRSDGRPPLLLPSLQPPRWRALRGKGLTHDPPYLVSQVGLRWRSPGANRGPRFDCRGHYHPMNSRIASLIAEAKARSAGGLAFANGASPPAERCAMCGGRRKYCRCIPDVRWWMDEAGELHRRRHSPAPNLETATQAQLRALVKAAVSVPLLDMARKIFPGRPNGMTVATAALCNMAKAKLDHDDVAYEYWWNKLPGWARWKREFNITACVKPGLVFRKHPPRLKGCRGGTP